MLQNSRQSRPRNIKLDRMTEMPSVKLLEDMRQRAMANVGSTVELPFGDESQTLILTVSRDASKGSWLWMMYRDDGFSSGLEWSHSTYDANYIHALIGNSNPGFLTKPRAMTSELPTSESSHPEVKIRRGALEGNLRNIQIANLLQSISMGQMTGRLEIVAAKDTARIFFSEGKTVHASIRGADGTEALIQLFAWEEGEFSFYDETITVATTITRGLTGLMMEGAAFVDHYSYLLTNGMSHEAIPTRSRDFASEDDLLRALKEGVDCKPELQTFLYRVMNGTTNWATIERNLNLKKTEWVPAVFNLVSTGIIRFSAVAVPDQSASTQKIDWSVAQGVDHLLSRADTGIHTYASLLYFMQQEFARYESFDLPFSLIVFGYSLKQHAAQHPSGFIPFKARAITELRERVTSLKRKYDIFSHYGPFAFALMIPVSTKENARRFAEIVADMASQIVISDEYDQSCLEFRAGFANIPGDCAALEDIFELAEKVDTLE